MLFRTLKPLRRAFFVFRYFIRSEPLRGTVMLFALLVAGLAEGIGIAALLPLLNIVANSGARSTSTVGQAVEDMLFAVNLQPSIGAMLLVIVLLTTAKAAFMLIAASQVSYTSARVTMTLRLAVLEHLLRARWSFFVGQRSGSLSTAIGAEAGRAASCFMQSARMLTSVIQICVYAGLSFLISWQVSFAALVVSVISSVILNHFVTIAGKLGKEQNRLTRSLLSGLVDGFQAMKPIKAMGREGQLFPLLAADIRELDNAQRRQIMSKESLTYYREPITALALAAGLYFLLIYWKPDLENLLIMALLFLRIVAKLSSLQTNMQGIASSLPAFWFIRSTISTARLAAEPRHGGKEVLLRSSIRLKDVSFAYGKKVVLQDISLVIPAGTFVTITGPSGSGKTTLADIITGLLRPQKGEVWIDDTDLRQADLSQWRRRIGYVPQETVLFHDTIFNNVTLKDERISEAEVISALKQADAWKFVEKQEDGIHTMVGERGTRLSGGQRQRLSIARALVGKPDLLILDEATTALDPETESAICATLRRLTGQVTIVAISHQTALQDAADVCYFVRDGRLLPSSDERARRPTGIGA